jgi:thiosulfate/3-mercaptopyruvate sulfurtransferase
MTPLVSVSWLQENLHNPNLRIVDCRFSLQDPLAGRMAYLENHLPGAIFLDLETELSGPLQPSGTGGRHPLPDPNQLAQTLGELGIGNASVVIAYDDPPAGGMYAPHLWWLLRWMGHTEVAVLDGGINAWRKAGLSTEKQIPAYPVALFNASPQEDLLVDASDVLNRSEKTVLIDSRAPERYRGEVEPIDRVAGHIPGATNLNWLDSLESTGQFKSPAAQAERFAGLEGEIITYCGSGVSATANVLALALAGRAAKLYAGSWSDWISEPSRPTQKQG